MELIKEKQGHIDIGALAETFDFCKIQEGTGTTKYQKKQKQHRI